MHRLIRLSFVSGLVLAAVSCADAAPLPDAKALDAVYQAKKPVRIPTADRQQKFVLNLPAIPKKPGVLCLTFRSYVYTPTPGGFNPYLAIEMNGKKLGRYVLTGEPRLVNHDAPLKTTVGTRDWWGDLKGAPVLQSFFAPGTAVVDKRIENPEIDFYLYVLDISDVANYVVVGPDQRIEKSAPNEIVFTNFVLKKWLAAESAMVLEDVTVGYLPEPMVASLRGEGRITKYSDIQDGVTLNDKEFSLTAGSAGGMEVRVGPNRYFFTASYSYPGEKEVGTNVLDVNKTTGEKIWRPAVRKQDDRTIVISAEGSTFALARTLTLDDGKIRVKDRITNKKDVPVGIIIQYGMAMDGLPKAGSYLLGGVENTDVMALAPENPTIFAAGKGSSLGMVAEDNVLRLQAELQRTSNTFSYLTKHFGLDAKKDYTLQFTVYPSGDKEYFGFINKVRRDWNVNYTLQGPSVNVAPDSVDLIVNMVTARAKPGIYIWGPWFQHWYPTGMTREGYRKVTMGPLASLRAIDPGRIHVGMLEMNIVPIDKRTIPGGHILPGPKDYETMNKQTYGYSLSKEQTKVLEASPYRDSFIRDAQGLIVINNGFGIPPGAENYLNALVYIEDGNHRCKTMLEQIDFMMDEMGFNGVYIDQFSMAFGSQHGNPDSTTYDRWDGHTVDIDDKGAIARKYTNVALIGATARAKVIQRVLDKGGSLVANSFPAVRETQSLRTFRFGEFENDPVNVLSYLDGKPPTVRTFGKGQLSSPIIFGLRALAEWNGGPKNRPFYADMQTKGIITALRNGLLYYYYDPYIPVAGPGAGEHGPTKHMFPFTPVELHEGWVLGNERILTCVSGTYRFPCPTKPTVYLFDRKGREKEQNFPVSKKGKIWEVAVELSDWNEICVIEDAPPVEKPKKALAADKDAVLLFNFIAGAGDLRDVSGHGNDGSIVSRNWYEQSPVWAAGREGRPFTAVNFHPTTNGTPYIRVADSASLKNMDSVTLEAVIRPRKASPHATIMAKGDAKTGLSHELYLTPQGDLVMALGGGQRKAVAPRAVEFERWQQVAGTYDGRKIRLFVEGKLVQEAEAPGRIAVNNGDLWIGNAGDPDVKTFYKTSFLGVIDQIRISRTARDFHRQ